jgi:hypothetical protein
MPSSTNGDYPFRLEFSAVIAESLRQLQRRASREGRGKEFLLAVRQVVERLRQNPSDFGEALYRLPALRMQIRCAALGPLGIDFAVCEDQPLVFIKAVKLLSTGS